MLRYVASKFFYMLVSLFILISATFFLMKAIPGDPFMGEKKPSPEILARLMEQYDLDKPVFQQYTKYLGNIVQGDFGLSMKKQGQSVTDIIVDTFGPSLRLGLIAIVVSVIVGVLLGMLAALYHRKLIDNIAMIISVLGIAVPSFVLASLLQYVLAEKAGIFNVMGFEGPLDYVLPVMALSAQPIAFIARLTRSSMLEVLHSDYIKTAKAKGLNWFAIMFRHVIRNGILPVVTYVGPMTANIITGSVVIEQIFGIGGIGKQFVESITNRDYTVIMGITIFYGILLMLARFVTDIVYVFVDPRIKLTGGKER
ncbi:ABC transporter permease [Paenibacillus sp. FSL W8-0187]|jgi:oligopeptide transport system permease protein|uniref:ABC transporter permease n=1 Tax=Paenibacillus lautus TaxID=1401 RepID=A0A328WP23_PAELA|nr:MULTISPECIES: ABC transporter permease [Paenibacillus]MBY0158265.1 ABC transporter permease [Cytobacillus firmus]AYB45558.1 ABC transporter permease [Paenibacillus lautus]MBU5348871.1 ABC transporter permease [Paenibacillus lautus]MBX4149953.1 ABC transporter permease [Paenibacillus lautus]MCI1772889.1 ABC transporter permease [Paenibacillus lautus]